MSKLASFSSVNSVVWAKKLKTMQDNSSRWLKYQVKGDLKEEKRWSANKMRPVKPIKVGEATAADKVTRRKEGGGCRQTTEVMGSKTEAQLRELDNARS